MTAKSNSYGIVVAVSGSRYWRDYEVIESAIDNLIASTGISLLVHGGCRGVDEYAGHYAKRRGVPVKVYNADWDLLGPEAGPSRNREMLKDSEAELLLTFHGNLDISRGTKDCIKAAKELGITHTLVEPCVRYSIYPDSELLELLWRASQDRKVTESTIIKEALEQYLKE